MNKTELEKREETLFHIMNDYIESRGLRKDFQQFLQVERNMDLKEIDNLILDDYVRDFE